MQYARLVVKSMCVAIAMHNLIKVIDQVRKNIAGHLKAKVCAYTLTIYIYGYCIGKFSKDKM